MYLARRQFIHLDLVVSIQVEQVLLVLLQGIQIILHFSNKLKSSDLLRTMAVFRWFWKRSVSNVIPDIVTVPPGLLELSSWARWIDILTKNFRQHERLSI